MFDVDNLPKGAAVQILDDDHNLVTGYVLGKDPEWSLKYQVTTDGGATYYARLVNAGDVLPTDQWKCPTPAARARARHAANAGNAGTA